MNIEQFEQKSLNYLKGKLDKQEVNVLLTIIANDAVKKKHFEELQRIWNAMEDDHIETPGESLRTGFYIMLAMHQLDNKKSKSLLMKIETFLNNLTPNKRIAQIAMVTIIAFISGFVGFQFNSKSTQKELLSYAQKVEILNTELTSAQLKSTSTSDRIEAIKTLSSHSLKEENIIKKLTNKLLYDDNLHVRMAAGKSLSVFDNNSEVKPAIIKAIRLEKELLVQVTLIDILITIDKEAAKKEIYKIYDSELSSPELKEIYENVL